MSCTVEQIAEKRRLAKERLMRSRQQQQQQPVVRTTPAASVVPPKIPNTVAAAPKLPSAGGNSASQFMAVNSFYSKSSAPVSVSPRHRSDSGGGKMKSSAWPNARPQPYSSPAGARSNNNGHHAAGAGAKVEPLAAVFLPTKSAHCSMVSAERFVVESGFHAQMIDIFKTIPSRAFDANTKKWTFHIDDYRLLRERMQPLQSEITLTHLPAFVLKLFDNSKQAPTTGAAALGLACLNALEPSIAAALLPFQQIGVCFGIEKQGRCMIADEMGLGKTYQALALADFYKNDWPLLVCTTAATRDSWATTVRRLMPYVSGTNVVCVTSKMEQQATADAKVLIMSYNLMERNSAELLRRTYPFVILDESHLLKNAKSKSTQAAIQLTKKARRVVLLSGTPALSRPSELFTQLHIIDPRFFNYKDYTTRYCDGKQTNFGWDASGQSNLVELNVVLSRKFMIRRTKQQVLFDLGEKSRETVLLDRALIEVLGDVAENMQSYANDVQQLKGRQRDEVLLQWYRETSLAKAKAVCAYLKGLVKDKEKFIVFAHHQSMLNEISKCMQDLSVDHIRIDGKTLNDTRTKLIHRFQTDDACRVAVLSLKACNAGITLTAAQLVIFAELDWNPATLAQAESRAHRIGQTGDVQCRYLLAQGTADDSIWRMLQEKQATLNKAGIFNDNVVDGDLRMAPTSSSKITGFMNLNKTGAIEVVSQVKDNHNLDDYFADDDDVDFGQLDL